MTDGERRPTDWPDDRLADAFLTRAAARPTPADLAEATLERVRRSAPRSTVRPGLRSIGALAAAAAFVAAVGAIAIGQRPVEPADQPTMALGLPVVTVSEAIAIRDTDPTDREIAVRGYFAPAQPIGCPAPQSGGSENPIRLDCPLMTQWLLENPERLVTRSSNSMEGRGPTGPAFHPVFPFIDMSAATAAERNDDPVDLVVIGHFHDRRGDPDTALCGTTPEANCDSFVVDGIHSVAGTRVASSTVIDLEPWPPEPRREPTWTPVDVDRLVQQAVPSFAILSRVALPGHRIRELEPSLGTGALGIIDRPIAWVVTGLDTSVSGSPPARRTFLIVDGTVEAYETAPWDVEPKVGFVPFALVGAPLAPSPSPTTVTLDLVDLDGRHLSVEIADESGLLVSAAPVAPGTPSDVPTPGNDVAVGQVAGQPNEISLNWVGGVCDGPRRFTIRPDGRKILLEEGPGQGDPESVCIAIGIQRSLTLTFSEPVPAAEVSIVKSSEPLSPAPSESPIVSTAVGDPISVSEAIERLRRNLDDTEIAVRGFVSSPPMATCPGRPAAPLLPQCPGGFSLLAEGLQPASASPGFDRPVRLVLEMLITPETYVASTYVIAGPLEEDPKEVIVLGHFGDHRAAQCPAEHLESCRRTFVVDALVDAEQPGLDVNAIEDVRPERYIETVATAADAERAATGAPRGAAIVLAAFAVSGSAVAEFEPQAAESKELTSAPAVWIVRYVESDVQRPVLRTKLIVDGPVDSLGRSFYTPTPDGLVQTIAVSE